MVVSCNNGTLSTFVPTDDNPWDISKVLLVFRRLGFGIKHSDIASKLSLTPSELIDELIDNAKNLVEDQDDPRKSGFSILDTEDSKTILSDLLRREYIEDRDILSGIQQTISTWKNHGLSPDQTQSHTKDPKFVLAANTYIEYERYLKACNAVDFDDLILKPVKLFRSNPTILAKWQTKIRYLLVDEYQDTNGIQYELVKLLTQISGALTVVGDDDQSIYAWRGAQPENLKELSNDFTTLKVIKLEQNYRSTRIILETANTLISNNPHIFEKVLWSDKGFGELIQILPTSTDEDEAEQEARVHWNRTEQIQGKN